MMNYLIKYYLTGILLTTNSIVHCVRVFTFTSSNGNSYSSSSDENCKIKSYGIKSSEELQTALNNAKSGDVIKLDAIVYKGSFKISNSGSNNMITLQGTSECGKSTKIIGDIALTIKADNWNVKNIVFSDSSKAVLIEDSKNIVLDNLVINNMRENAVTSQNSDKLQFNNLVIENIGGNAIVVNSGNNIDVRSLVIGNVKGIGILVDGTSSYINILSTVSRDVGSEVIKIGGQTDNGDISNSVITGDSPNAEAWVKIEGNNFNIESTVGNGNPQNGFMIYGCGFNFNSNMCNMWGSNGYCIYLLNKSATCRNRIGWGNMAIGGSGTSN